MGSSSSMVISIFHSHLRSVEYSRLRTYLAAEKTQEALAEAQAAVTLVPNALESQVMLGDVFEAVGQT